MPVRLRPVVIAFYKEILGGGVRMPRKGRGAELSVEYRTDTAKKRMY